MIAENRNDHQCSSDCCSPNRKPPFKGGLITPFTGKTRVYSIKTIYSGSEQGFVKKNDSGYKVNPGYECLVAIIDDLYRHVYPERAKRNPELTTERILKGLSYPRTILELILYEDIPVGYGGFPRLDIDGEPVLYSSRTILSEHVQEGVGTHILEKAIELQRKKAARTHGRPLRNGMLMTQNYGSIRSLEILQERGAIERIQPIGEPFDQEGKRILYRVHSMVFVASDAIEATGCSRGELREVGINETAVSPKEGTRGWFVQQKMVLHPPYGAGINILAGDVLYVRYIIPERQNPQEAFILSGK